MLVDFLKGNHFEIPTATVPWLWEAKGLACCCEGESLRCGLLGWARCPSLNIRAEASSLAQAGREVPKTR
jgi:hypothetical protein